MNYTGPKARRSRALGVALTPKCERYLEARPYPPGVHGRGRRSVSDYALRLKEKQRLRYQYNVSEKQLRRAFDRALRKDGKTGELLVTELERRLDALVLRAGFARTIYQARQLVTHRHILVNGHRVDKPSFQVAVGDVVGVAERSRTKPPFQLAAAGAHKLERTAPYLAVNLPNLQFQLTALPKRAQVPVVCEEQLVVEFYSR
jgi:small subunit ribosomal protein S4